jgi:hypothetical protein
MISQIPGGAAGLDQLLCDGNTLRGSAIETDDSSHRFVAQVTDYARALGVALVQKAYDTHESSERAPLKELLGTPHHPSVFRWCLCQGADVLLTVKSNQNTLPSMSWLSSESPLWLRVMVCVRFGGCAPNRGTDRPTHCHS